MRNPTFTGTSLQKSIPMVTWAGVNDFTATPTPNSGKLTFYLSDHGTPGIEPTSVEMDVEPSKLSVQDIGSLNEWNRLVLFAYIDLSVGSKIWDDYYFTIQLGRTGTTAHFIVPLGAGNIHVSDNSHSFHVLDAALPADFLTDPDKAADEDDNLRLLATIFSPGSAETAVAFSLTAVLMPSINASDTKPKRGHIFGADGFA